jgi:hypothetical protein
MSGTAARALGPVGALTFGLPISLGLGIDAIHASTSLLLVVATAIVFWQLARLNIVLAWSWLIVFTAMRMVWWDAAMFWVNTLLLPLGLLILVLFTACLRRPSPAQLAGLAFVLLLALQVHLVALVGLPILLIAGALVLGNRLQRGGPLRDGDNKASRVPLILGLALIVVALLPYVVAEVATNFRNTRAMFSHIGSAAHSTGGEGLRAATETIVLATDPMALFPQHTTLGICVGGLTALAALVLLAWNRRRVAHPEERAQTDAITWLVLTAAVGVGGQALFFLVMARPLNGLHYAILLAPWYAIPAAALLAAVVSAPRERARAIASVVLGAIAVLLLIVRGPTLADRFAERTPWNYSAVITALDTLCEGQAVQTLEGPGLVDTLTPGYDSVLRYVMNRGFSRCRYDPMSDIVIAANRDASFEDAIELAGQRFTRERVMPPGVARYRRVP